MRAGAVAIASPTEVEVAVTIRAATTSTELIGKDTEEAELLENGLTRPGQPAHRLRGIVIAHMSTSSSTKCASCRSTLGGFKRSVYR